MVRSQTDTPDIRKTGLLDQQVARSTVLSIYEIYHLISGCFFELKELIDVKPDAGSCYIRSVCEPFDIEMELDLKKAENWLTHFGLYPYTHIHASGHLNYDEIRDVVETVQPQVLIPVHTQHPEVFQNFHDNVILPEKGVAIII